MVQAGCYQLVLEPQTRRLHASGWLAIVAAGNRDADRAATTRMPTPLRNRFGDLDFEVDIQE